MPNKRGLARVKHATACSICTGVSCSAQAVPSRTSWLSGGKAVWLRGEDTAIPFLRVNVCCDDVARYSAGSKAGRTIIEDATGCATAWSERRTGLSRRWWRPSGLAVDDRADHRIDAGKRV